MTKKEDLLEFLKNNLPEDDCYPKNRASDREIYMYKTKSQMLDRIHQAYYNDKEQFNQTLQNIIKDLEETKW